jgi:hypothetical protein
MKTDSGRRGDRDWVSNLNGNWQGLGGETPYFY